MIPGLHNLLPGFQRLLGSEFGSGGGGGGGGVAVPAIPKPPSIKKMATQFQKALPVILSTAREFDPQFAQLLLEQYQRFLPQFSELMRTEQRKALPVTYDLQEKLANIATEGLTADLPKFLKDSYLDQLRSELGGNAGAPVGAEYISRNLAALGEQYRNYYQNMGISLINRIPAPQPFLPELRQTTGNFNLGEAAQYVASTYGAYASATGQVASSAIAANAASQRSGGSGFSLGGLITGGLGSLIKGGGGGFGGLFKGSPISTSSGGGFRNDGGFGGFGNVLSSGINLGLKALPFFL